MSHSLFASANGYAAGRAGSKRVGRHDLLLLAITLIAAAAVLLVTYLPPFGPAATNRDPASVGVQPASGVPHELGLDIVKLRAELARLSGVIEARFPDREDAAPLPGGALNGRFGADSPALDQQHRRMQLLSDTAHGPGGRGEYEDGRIFHAQEDEAPQSRREKVLPPNTPRLLLKQMARVDDISTEEFFHKYGNAFVAAPVVITNSLTGSYNPADWTREGITRLCGNRRLRYKSEENCDDDDGCHNVREVDPAQVGKTWAALTSTNLSAVGINTIADFMRVQSTTRPGMYIHDASIVKLCPALLDRFKNPKYFPHDLRQLSSTPHRPLAAVAHKQWHPSLFVGTKGTGSPLHSDSAMTRFWLMQLDGRKHVRLIPPSENWRAGLNDFDNFQPTLYRVDLFKPDFAAFPDMDGLLVYETVLHPGDLLFVPEGWAHQVVNLDDIIATSKNFVDFENVAMHLRATEEEASEDPDDQDEDQDNIRYWKDRLRAWYLPLVRPSENISNIPWDEYFMSHQLESAPLPETVRDIVRLKSTTPPPNSSQADPERRWLDSEGRSLLTVAVWHNFVAAAQYLLEHSGVDPSSGALGGADLREYAQRQNYTRMDLVLKEAGVA